ncbi:MAG: sulfate ABC transporter substrate-binding protein [Leptolyngbya sp.]|nr:MAG: sulfate ABC transporter substrate-binding protein [Leptolyngbya sp.]
MQHSNRQADSSQQPSGLPVAAKLVSFLRPNPVRFTAVLVASGLGLASAIPALSTSFTAIAPVRSQQSQLISQKPRQEILLVSYAVTKAAYDKIIPKFVAKWKKEKGQDVTIRTSYGGSGSQTRAILDGLEADVTALALGADTQKLQKGGLIKAGWEKELPNNSIVTKSVIAIVTRPGNPKKIKTWQDLDNAGVRVVTANPKTSGGARWNFLGLWGSVTETGGNDAKAQGFVSRVYKNAPVLPKDAREASDIFFKKGQGDVLLNYENEVILEQQQLGSKSPYVIPSVNISIDNPIAVVDKNVDKRGTRAISEAFAKFLFTPEAQREFASVGFRPVNATVAKQVGGKFPKVSKLYTVAEFGGWDSVQKRFFDDGAVFDKIYSRR